MNSFQTVGLQCDWLEADDIINGAIRLVARLEEDRQETLVRLDNEKLRVHQLGENLDKECEKRLRLLPSVIQKGTWRCFYTYQVSNVVNVLYRTRGLPERFAGVEMACSI